MLFGTASGGRGSAERGAHFYACAGHVPRKREAEAAGDRGEITLLDADVRPVAGRGDVVAGRMERARIPEGRRTAAVGVVGVVGVVRIVRVDTTSSSPGSRSRYCEVPTAGSRPSSRTPRDHRRTLAPRPRSSLPSPHEELDRRSARTPSNTASTQRRPRTRRRRRESAAGACCEYQSPTSMTIAAKRRKTGIINALRTKMPPRSSRHASRPMAATRSARTAEERRTFAPIMNCPLEL